jgi:hypothetical protein
MLAICVMPSGVMRCFELVVNSNLVSDVSGFEYPEKPKS